MITDECGVGVGQGMVRAGGQDCRRYECKTDSETRHIHTPAGHIHCRRNRVEGVAAYGRAALHWEADYWQTAEGQDALQHGIAISCNPRPVQFRAVCRAGLAAMVEGRLRTLASTRPWEDGLLRA